VPDPSKRIAAGYQVHHNGDLTGLTAATSILKWLSQGYTKDQVYKKFNGDIQLVCAWIDFLKYKQWIVEAQKENDLGTGMRVTKEGKIWLKRFESANIKVNR
jgi:hypothetical protein